MKTADINRRLENLLRLGSIAEVNHSARKVRVHSGALLTNWLDWPADIGRNYKRWRPLRVGTQVLLGCISGDPAQAQIIGTLFSNDFPSPSTEPEVDLIAFDDGSYLQHHADTGLLHLHAHGDLHLTADGNIKIIGSRVDIN